MEICCQVYGEDSLLSSRLYINIGIVYEDNNDYVKAYEFFRKWAEVSEAVLGPDHPKTIRAKGVLREPRYRLVAQRLKQHAERSRGDENSGGGPDSEDGELDEGTINQEVENMDEEEDGDDPREDRRKPGADRSARALASSRTGRCRGLAA